jgi:hypothetical protein
MGLDRPAPPGSYDNLIADLLTRRLGVGGDVREQGRKLNNARWEITGVPNELIEEFSQRSTEITDQGQAGRRLPKAHRARARRHHGVAAAATSDDRHPEAEDPSAADHPRRAVAPPRRHLAAARPAWRAVGPSR